MSKKFLLVKYKCKFSYNFSLKAYQKYITDTFCTFLAIMNKHSLCLTNFNDIKLSQNEMIS